MIRALTVLALVCTAFAATAADAAPAGEARTEAAAPALAGTFAITITSSDGEKNEDVLTFEGGKLTSQSYSESRFAAGDVTLKGDKFTAVMASPRGSEAVWSGTVKGDAIEGTVMTGVKGQYDRGTFTGTRR